MRTPPQMAQRREESLFKPPLFDRSKCAPAGRTGSWLIWLFPAGILLGCILMWQMSKVDLDVVHGDKDASYDKVGKAISAPPPPLPRILVTLNAQYCDVVRVKVARFEGSMHKIF